MTTLANLEGGETFDASALGHADEVVEERVADDELLYIKGCKAVNIHSIVLRGANAFMLDEMERYVLLAGGGSDLWNPCTRA